VSAEGPRLTVAMASDTGHLRQNNEDAMAIDAALGLIVLADGMGGHNAGEVASNLAVSAVCTALAAGHPDHADHPDRPVQLDHADPPPDQRLVAAIQRAHGAIHALAQTGPAYTGMGTTLVAALFSARQVCVAHVGDSRLYRFRDGSLTALTRDHSLLEEMVAHGQYAREQARQLVKKNLLTRALGVEPAVEVDVQVLDTAAGDLYLACSDGLTDMIDDPAISACLQRGQHRPLQDLADALVQAALIAGGRDNVSVVVARLGKAKPWYQRLLEQL